LLSGVPVAGWLPGEMRAFEVAGWSASLGHEWNPDWLMNRPDYGFGLSSIGVGFAGGTDSNGSPLPPLVTFGVSPSITTGFLIVIPEPSAIALTVLSIAGWLGFRRRLPQRTRKET